MALLSMQFDNFMKLAELEANYRNKKDEGLRYDAKFVPGEKNTLLISAENQYVGTSTTMTEDEYFMNRKTHLDKDIVEWLFNITKDKVFHPERFARGD